MRDVETSLRCIEDLLAQDGHFERVQPLLAQARTHYLQNLQLFPTIARLLDRRARPVTNSTGPVTLRAEYDVDGLAVKVRRRLWRP